MHLLCSIDFILIFIINYFILHNLLEYKTKNSYAHFIFLLFTIPIVILYSNTNEFIFSIVTYFLFILICIFFKYLFLEIAILTIIKIFIFTYFTNILFTSLFILFVNIPYTNTITIGICISVNFLFLLSLMLCKKYNLIQLIINSTIKTVKNIIFASLIISAVLVGLLSDSTYFEKHPEWSIIIRVVAILFIFTIGLILYIMISNSVEKSLYKRTSEIYEEQIQVQATHYANIAKNNYDLRKFKHDYKHMRIVISELISQNKFSEALEMLNTGYNDLLKMESSIKFNTGNEILNAILADKQIKATKSNTVIEFSGNLPNELISSLDLCIIFGNVLDNAIEACEKISGNEPKIILVNSDYSAGLVFLTITNPVENNIKIKGDSLSTTKLDKSNHGFGIYSIKKALEKYNGQITLCCEDYKFTTEINFEMPSIAKV